MSEQTKSNGKAFIGWGIFLLIFPAIGGTIFLLSTSFNFLEYILLVIAFSYVLWGWASVIVGIILIAQGVKRKKALIAKASE